jgi:hypothetical protein
MGRKGQEYLRIRKLVIPQLTINTLSRDFLN